MSLAPRKTPEAHHLANSKIYVLGRSTCVALSSHLMLFVTTIITADFVIALHSARRVNILEIRISVMTDKYPSEG